MYILYLNADIFLILEYRVLNNYEIFFRTPLSVFIKIQAFLVDLPYALRQDPRPTYRKPIRIDVQLF